MSEIQTKQEIQKSVFNFDKEDICDSAIDFFSTLGYRSQRRMSHVDITRENISELFDSDQPFYADKALTEDWVSVHFLFQLAEEDLDLSSQERLPIGGANKYSSGLYKSYIFFAVDLEKEYYTRTQLSQITREINKLFMMPVMVLFRHGNSLSLAIIDRRPNKREEHKDVLEKITLIKDIQIKSPHRAHIEILFDLSLEQLNYKHEIRSMMDLHHAWQKTLDASELNKRFFKELANWYFWAVDKVEFPEGAGDDEETRNATSVIRLITRLIFIWFIKEKGLVPDILFERNMLDEVLTFDDPNESTYYKAILQNLFFATLNQEMNTEDNPDNRKFRGRTSRPGGRDQHYLIHNVYRYERYFKDSDQALRIFEDIPFLNGGLFECLDHKDKDNPRKVIRIDGFSDRDDNPLRVPDELFFGEEREVDLNEAYGTTSKTYKTCGLIHILNRYKFTLEENTPIDQEVALDPELLGRVFENLLAAYNPETGSTARKNTGSYYTPREIVDYLVDESLVIYFSKRLKNKMEDTKNIEGKLRELLSYFEASHSFNEMEADVIINSINDLSILDPAVGSGAFPMGVLLKLVLVLSKLDPGNRRWKKTQLKKASQISDPVIREKFIQDIEKSFEENTLDYGRKLYLIENCIFGVDIQPIAVQIAKLRFYISLIIDQDINKSKGNYGLQPLPNLETKFVAANSLVPINKPQQRTLRNPEIDEKEEELAELRRRTFSARTPKTKEKYRKLEKQIRLELSELLEKDGFQRGVIERIISWDPYDKNDSASFFDPEWMFGNYDLFDIVIGNPPYIGEKGNKDKFAVVKRGPLGKRYYQGKMDYFYFFFHLALNLVKTGGVVSYITTNYYITADGAENLRRDIKKRSIVKNIVNFNELKIFEAATGQHNMITVLVKNGSISDQILVNTAITHRNRSASKADIQKILAGYDNQTDYYEFEQGKLFHGSADYIRLALKPVSAVLDKMLIGTVPLSELCNVNQGIITGADKVTQRHIDNYDISSEVNDGIFVLNDIDIERIEINHNERSILRPWFKNSDVARWVTSKEPNEYVIYSSYDTVDDIKNFPNIYQHLRKFEEITSRYSYRWHDLHRPRDEKIFKGRKIVAPQRSRFNVFGFNNRNWYASADVYFITKNEKEINVSLKYLLGLLNSHLYYIWLYHRGKRKGEDLELYATPLNQIPIPMKNKNNSETISEIERVVNKILEIKEEDPSSDVSLFEEEIDNLVYKLYKLDDEEVRLIKKPIAD